MSRYEEGMKLAKSMEQDMDKFYQGNNAAAGTRVRGVLQEIKVLSQTVRQEIQDMKNSMKSTT